ncbi:MAG: hypothetical protein ACI4CZ_01470 [Hominisplanchenecus sp.]
MNEQMVKEQLYQRYIEPTKRQRENYIGIEIEIPIVNLKKEAVDFAVVHGVTAKFMERFGFHPAGLDDEGNIYSAVESVTGDILSYDCSYNNLELSLGKEKDLNTIYERFTVYYTFLWEKFGEYGHTLTGFGVNPYRRYNHNVPIPSERYRMLLHHLRSYKNYKLPMYFHEYPEYGTFSSASQVQLDVFYDELLETLETFGKVEPVKALLFSNSVLLGENEELLCCRDMFWENSTHGINPHNIGMFDCRLESMEDLEAYIASASIYCVERDGKYIHFAPIPIKEYLRTPVVTGEWYDSGVYQKTQVQPRMDDIRFLRTFKFEDLTFRGTVEFRSVCCQPIKDCMTVAAFHVGLKENLHSLTNLLHEDHVLYHQGYTATELRKMFVKSELPGFVDADALYELVRSVVDIASEGLEKRGFGEEGMLKPLYDRIEERENPAQRMLRLRREGMDLKDIILEYGKL